MFIQFQPETNGMVQNYIRHKYISQCSHCRSMEPCSYNNEVVLRIIVLVYDRVDSLRKCLDSLQEADIMGVEAALEIWIDISKGGKVDYQVLELAQSFNWRHGPSCVHIQSQHVNVGFQWIYSWRPRPGSKEIGVFIEDDVDVSKYFFRYLIKARNFYSNYKDIIGICLNDEICQISHGPNQGKQIIRPTNRPDNVYLYTLFSTWGYAPFPDHWRAFQDWCQNVSHDQNFDPTTEEAALQSKWYRDFKKHGRADTMLHEMYLIRYSIDHKLMSLYPNLHVLHPHPQTSLTTNRRERGLHYKWKKLVQSHALNIWKEEFTIFPKYPIRFTLSGAPTI